MRVEPLHIVPFHLFLPLDSVRMPPKTATSPQPASDQSTADSEGNDAGHGGDSSNTAQSTASGGAVVCGSGNAEQALSDAVFALIGLPFDQLEAQLQGLK